ncbi:hypothetical protein Gotri_015298 [Gossypium trilobum]|uniref:Uncharacterized protein n=1 Tax=Gossypium trilobum TaxID=34281 RepID=A0A7J9DZN6_9ROSI|nr:hypothetical protein [Gossypium trilobum]
MENDIVGLTIQNEEENAWQISSNGDDPVSNFGLCLVGCFLTASVVNFEEMQNIMANL